jgi:hypothetical protein
MILSILSYFQYEDSRLNTIASHLLQQQMPDGGWNCRRQSGATHSSVNTTISVLEGLRHFELNNGRQTRKIRLAQRRGREFLLLHRLFRSHTTGEIIKPVFTLFSFPPRWHYDILRALDYSRPSTPRATLAWQRRSISSAAVSAKTGDGHCNTLTKARPISNSNALVRPAAGIPYARCGCSSGGMAGTDQGSVKVVSDPVPLIGS